MRYARLVNNIVAEIVDLPEGGVPVQYYGTKLGKQFVEAPGAEIGFVFNGSKFNPPREPEADSAPPIVFPSAEDLVNAVAALVEGKTDGDPAVEKVMVYVAARRAQAV